MVQKLEAGEGPGMRLGLLHLVYDLMWYKNWRRGRPGNEAHLSPSPVYDLPLWGRLGNKAWPPPSPVYDLPLWGRL